MDQNSPESVSEELERLAEEQLTELHNEDPSLKQVNRERRERVIMLYAQGGLKNPSDFYHAALVLLYGQDLEHLELARTFAKHATTVGENRAWWVIAAAWDRWLLERGKPQRFGTQFFREDGRWTMGDVDPKTTDAQRAFYAVPPLWFLRQNLQKLRQSDGEIEE